MDELDKGWFDNEREKVLSFLEAGKIDHLGVGEPVFDEYPDFALWAVESKENPGSVGWWAISGDCPTDYIPTNQLDHPRKALRKFATLWADVAEYMLRGEQHPEYAIGTPEQWPMLGELMQARAETLEEYANDEELWD